jgi:hypothetical protein
MFADLFHRLRDHPGYESAFVDDVVVRRTRPPDPRMERLLLACWVLIALKHVAVIWAVHRYSVPFHQLWVNAPTWLLAFVATAVYYCHHRRP